MDKLASQNKGVKYLLVAIDVFLRFVRVQTMKNKYAKDTLQAFKKMISRKNTPEKLWVDTGTGYGGTSFKKFCKEKSIEVYSTMSETKAAFAERAIQSLKHNIYRYIEGHGEKFINKLPQFVSTMNCRINRSIGKSPRDVKNTDFLSILYNKPLTRCKKLKFKVGDRVRISKSDINHNLQMKLLKFLQYLQKSLLHISPKISTKKKLWDNFVKNNLENVLIKGKSFFKLNFYRSVVMDFFTIELVSNASFNCYPNNSLSSFTNFLPEQIHLKGEWEVAISEISYPSWYQNVTEGKLTFVDGRESSEEKRKIVPMNSEPECIQVFLI